jgi:hypothetical protein
MHAHFAVIADNAARARSRAAATALAAGTRALAAGTTALAAATLFGGCTSDPRAPARFPDEWMGHWSGTLEMHGARPSEGEVRMELVIGPSIAADRLAWTIVYDGAAGRQVREYQLLTRDPAAGSYAIDERNGIVLEARVHGEALYSWFSIGGANVTVREQLVRDANGERLEVEMVTAADRDTLTTGPDGEVRSLVPISVQRASLRRTALRPAP